MLQRLLLREQTHSLLSQRPLLAAPAFFLSLVLCFRLQSARLQLDGTAQGFRLRLHRRCSVGTSISQVPTSWRHAAVCMVRWRRARRRTLLSLSHRNCCGLASTCCPVAAGEFALELDTQGSISRGRVALPYTRAAKRTPPRKACDLPGGVAQASASVSQNSAQKFLARAGPRDGQRKRHCLSQGGRKGWLRVYAR